MVIMTSFRTGDFGQLMEIGDEVVIDYDADYKDINDFYKMLAQNGLDLEAIEDPINRPDCDHYKIIEKASMMAPVFQGLKETFTNRRNK